MGRYYSFEVNGKYLAADDAEELLFVEKEDGKLPDNAKWYLYKPQGKTGYVICNKAANYNGSPVCIEYYSAAFSGWTFKSKEPDIFLFQFYPVKENTKIVDSVVQVPSVVFDCEDSRYIEQDFPVIVKLDDLCDTIDEIGITVTVKNETYQVEDYEASADGKSYSFTVPSSFLDAQGIVDQFDIEVEVTNGYDIFYMGTKIINMIDEPFFDELTPAPGSQTGDDKKPVISAKVGNVGDAPAFQMFINEEEITDFVFENGVLSYTPAEDMADGRTVVKMVVTRADGVSAEKSWNFTVGKAGYQLYFGQLHSHTSYSDGLGSLESALDYVSSLPESANVQFVAFTDHSNKFDTESNTSEPDALNDIELMNPAPRARWEEYKGTIADFNSTHHDIVAIGGFEMTWSGGPGHINTFDSEGLISRNHAGLNNKTDDSGMRLYYQTLNKGDSLSQFNHPGTTFGNFNDFSYRDDETDDHMFLVEVGNGEGIVGAGGYYPSYEEYILALDKGWHVAPTNN